MDAAQRLANLTGEADNLRAALAGLADVSKANAAAQEKLLALESNKSSRLGYSVRGSLAGVTPNAAIAQYSSIRRVAISFLTVAVATVSERSPM